MQVRVKSLQGEEYFIQIQNHKYVSQLKESIKEQANGLPVERQKLVYKGRTMQDSSLVSEYNLEEDCKIHLIVQKEPLTAKAAKESASGMTPTTNELSLPSSSNQSTSSNCSMDTSGSVRDNDEITKMLGQGGCDSKNDDNSSSTNDVIRNSNAPTTESRFAAILRERLAAHFPSRVIDRIIENLYQEIDADINSSSLDDLERLAKQKLNITNE